MTDSTTPTPTPVQITSTVYKCNECDKLTYDAVEEPVYECNSCGTKFTRGNSAADNHQCPDCKKFGSKVSEYACPDCEQDCSEADEYYQCSICDQGDDSLFESDDDLREHYKDSHWEEIFEYWEANQ